MDYYDVESILADEERLKVAFNHDVHNFGFFMSGTTERIPKDTPVSFPVYLIAFLYKNGHCKLVDSPTVEYKDDFDVEPAAVNLKNSYFFRMMVHFESTEWLANLFYSRISTYIRRATKENLTEDDINMLSMEERNCLVSSRKTFQEYQKYLFKQVHLCITSQTAN